MITTDTQTVITETTEKRPRSVASSLASTPEKPRPSKRIIAMWEARRHLALERGPRTTMETTEMIEFRAMVDGLVDSELKRIRSVATSPVTTPEKAPPAKKHHQ